MFSTMTGIPKWLPTASVGNPKLDEQHIVLLELGRSLLAALATRSANSLLVRDILSDIVNQFQEHIVLEEQTLEVNACPTLDEHRVEHQNSINRFAKLLGDASQGQCESSTVVEVIKDWTNHHIFENDLPVTRYMHSH
jgi:hemerythrin-like metal-binding protein